MKEKRFIVDTTLRDGEQSPFIHFSPEQKIVLAQKLDRIGVSQIEAGVVALSRGEQDTICQIIENRKNADISVWARLRSEDVKKALECAPQVIHVSVPVSYLHIYKKIGKNKAWVLKQLQEILEIIVQGNSQLSVGFEDASRAEVSFLLTLLEVVSGFQEKMKMVRIADTVGGTAPFQNREMIKFLVKESPIPLEFHGHNDLGLAVSNTMVALKSGAIYADTTLSGIGERSGNCHFLHLLELAGGSFDFGISLEEARDLEYYFQSILEK